MDARWRPWMIGGSVRRSSVKCMRGQDGILDRYFDDISTEAIEDYGRYAGTPFLDFLGSSGSRNLSPPEDL